MSEILIEIQNVTKEYSLGRRRTVKALQDVSLAIRRGETLGIVGESGSGKSTLARIIMGAEQAGEGQILYGGEPLCLKRRENRLEFAKKAQMVFQDSYASLDPRMTVKESIAENLFLHGWKRSDAVYDRVSGILEQVGLPASTGQLFPHELSGGQRQRVGIAKALIISPEFLLCDEPVSALDLSVQSQILNLLRKLKGELGLTYLFIAHDLNLVQYISDRIAVLYRGRVMELGEAGELCRNPRHPYTKLLFESVLSFAPGEEPEELLLSDNEWQASFTEKGCPFAGRCKFAKGSCVQNTPVLKEISQGHFSACGLNGTF